MSTARCGLEPQTRLCPFQAALAPLPGVERRCAVEHSGRGLLGQQRHIGRDQRPFLIGHIGRIRLARGVHPQQGTPQVRNTLQARFFVFDDEECATF